jgi:hypothetical protein
VPRAHRPELADRLGIFAPLIGSWVLRVEDIGQDGAVEVSDGEWHFGWALDGRALADVWLSPSRAARATGARDGEWGLSLRFWDGLVLEGERDDVRLHWIFSDITPTSFQWRAEEAEPGADFRVRQRFTATRSR